jgi:hypothetical protein
MPIKFRCQHCRQFLGISRSKAGDVVDCPTCGRSVRVPNLDGTVAPVPEPKLNVNELAGALDELARIGEESSGKPGDRPSADEFSPAHQPLVVKELAPLPRPEPISLAPAPVAVAVDIHAQKPRSFVEARSPADSPAAIAPQPGRGDASFPAVLKSWPVISVLLALALVAFSLGWLAGGIGRGGPAVQPEHAEDGGKPIAKQPAVRQLHPVYHPDSWKTAVKGQITYRTSDGKNRPDDGARIIILPETRKGGLSKLPVAGFWAAANEADFRVAQAGLRELGGNAALADADGNFTIKLPPSSGNYQVIAISHYKESDLPNDELPPSTRGLLDNYFEQPDSLIRKLAYKHGQLKFDGSKVELWNHSFE